MEEGQKEPVSFTSDGSQNTSQEETREDEQKKESLDMILDGWEDSITFGCGRYSSSHQSLHDTIFACSITTKIVGLGDIKFNAHELLELVRYPQSPYDKSAIKVFNSSSEEVGYLDIPVARVLSPLVDLQKINLEGGEVTGSRNRSDSSIPCLVKIFSKSDDTQSVKEWILRKALCFSDQPGPGFRAYEGRGVQEKNMVEKLGSLEPPKNVIKAKLLDHQKEGLWWLVSKERSDELPPFWEVKDGLYLNVLTMHRTDRRPEPLHGGIFADDHGLGKTLTLLSLISFDKVGTLPDESSSVLVAKQTLIVCPSVVCSTWESQLQEHTHKGSLKLYKYYGNSRTMDFEELKKYDIVLTTYRTLAAECFRRRRCPLRKIEWWRIILDEAHVIKNENARQSRAVTKLTARRRWAVTGTNIKNGLFDSVSLMAFLQLDPLSSKCYWKGLFQRPLADGDENVLQVLMATISLRRIKDKVLIGLPSKTVETVSFELSGEERELYDRMKSSSKYFFDFFSFVDILRKRYSFMLSLVSRLRKLCDDSALCSRDLTSLLPSDNIQDASKHPEFLGKMINMIQDGEDFVCAICGCPSNDAVITQCVHVFCKSCIWYYLPRKELEKACPSCGGTISRSGLFSSPRESSNSENTKKTSRATPSKVSALIELLKESSVVNSSRKSVVFSMFDKMVVLLEEPLKDAGFNTLRLEAAMDEREQAEVIKGFGSAGPGTVLLASFRTSGFGINLTSASNVFLLEPWWTPADEEQAINRVHHYGQKENVRVVRLVAQNSIEERVVEMQERKKVAAGDVVRKGQKERREAGNVPEEVSVSSGKKRGRVSEKDAGEPKKESSGGMADKSSSALVAKQTLIVCPSSVCSTWKNQLQEHTESGSLKLYKYYGENKIKDVEELKKYDIVLTTYGTFAIESYEEWCPLLKIEWWRVILDEADVIKNANAKQSMAVSSLTTRRRWAVTGAPIHNGSFDLFALIAFLRLDPLSNKSYWQSLFERPLAKQDENGFSRLQVLMASISLRRRKDRVLAGRLQSKTVETVRFKISGNEREQYDNMEAETKKVVRKLIEFDTGRLNRSYASIRGAVMRLRQMCNDSTPFSLYLKSLLPSADIGDASDRLELLRKLIDVLREDEDFDCAICYFPPTDAVITKCKHVFCKRCIRACLRRTRNNCPICRGPLSISDLFSAPPQSFEEPRRFPAIIPSKVSTLIKLLKESRDVRSTSKSVVFTLFQKTLVQLQEPLKEAGFNVLRLDALSDSRRRDGIIKRFRSAGQDTVLLANVKVSGAGINLTAASEVYLLEPWWNSAFEERAIDRVLQYGQEKNVRIVRLIVEDSIEERILAMQERKKQAIEASGRQGPEERREVSKEDLCSLLSLNDIPTCMPASGQA